MRIAMGIEYDGTHYHGWQTQKNAHSVQERLEQALSRVADHPVSVVCAGRTDAGVHGVGQVIHFDSDARRTERNWLKGVHVNLPHDISVTWVKTVPDSFHARFSAISRSYRYQILNRPNRSALWAKRATWVFQHLDEVRMAAAAQHLIGEHDFSSYRALACQAKHPVRTLHRLDVTRDGELIRIDATANGFLHHMVRNIAGVLIAIGKGEQPTDWSREVLGYRDRTLGGVTAPPDGLYLMGVRYPPELDVPPRP